jgi:hypothetical protein
MGLLCRIRPGSEVVTTQVTGRASYVAVFS